MLAQPHFKALANQREGSGGDMGIGGDTLV